ncbi:hypothetical protein H0H92_010426 [Tricholoma furcatifolium]|nr:hypothetical protein H0H92_010426 [Tricholoma furcatifolium]
MDELFHLTSLPLETGKWKENKLKRIAAPHDLLSHEAAEPLPPLRGAADAFGTINGHRVIMLFGGLDVAGNPTADLYIIHLDKAQWWKADVANGNPDSHVVVVSPRVDANMAFVGNRLYVFGGRGHAGAGTSYAIAEYDAAGWW